MKTKKLLSLLIGVSLIMSSAMIGCKSSKTNGEASKKKKKSKEEVKMDKNQFLNLIYVEPKTLDLSRSSDVYSSEVLGEVYEGLTRVEQVEGKDVIKPAGAKDWELSEDGKVWTFHLRDYNWSDGKKVTAKDFIYSIKRTLNPKTGSSYAFLLSPIKGADEYNSKKGSLEDLGVKAIDDKTLEFTLKQPCPYFLDLTYFKLFMPLRQDIVEKHGEKYGSEAETLEVYCGPFVIKSWTHQSEVVLEKNEKYWDKDSVKLQKATFKIIKDETAKYNALYSGQLDSLGVSKKEWIEKYNKTLKFENLKGYLPSTGYTFFNQKNKLFSNINVRKAFSLAFTREDYAEVISKGKNVPAYGWCPPSVLIGNKDFRDAVGEEPIKKLAEENPNPKELLIKGLKELGMDPDPSKLKINFLLAGTDQTFRTLAEYEQEMYKKSLGVNIIAEYVEWGVFQKRTNEMKYEMAAMAWTGDYNDPNTFFDMWMTDANMVPTGWSNKKYDDLIKTAMSTLDNEERLKAYKEAEKILLYEDSVIVPTTYSRKNTYMYKYVKNLMTPLFGTGIEFKYAYTDGREK
ncbi:peptide ABC transporter substrate-binding protein [Haloimpatiens sp. FM7315]|uniref:peptide ABC transporter substrate-binding protein n=1 Tax=Haloimpatiens sp. FM7315 TaxID=3298609 RepID=UPI00370B3015